MVMGLAGLRELSKSSPISKKHPAKSSPPKGPTVAAIRVASGPGVVLQEKIIRPSPGIGSVQ